MSEIKVEQVSPFREVTTTTDNVLGLETKVTMTKDIEYAKTIPKSKRAPTRSSSSFTPQGFSRPNWDKGWEKIEEAKRNGTWYQSPPVDDAAKK